MKKMFVLFLICFLGSNFSAYGTLTATYVPVVKTGGANPTVQNGSIVDTGTSSGAGNVGIGSTAPRQALDVQGTVQAVAFIAGSGTATITGSGANVGIGSATPGQALDVNGTVRATYFVGNGSGITNITSSQWTTINTNDVYLPSTGNVGIGTSLTTNASLSVLKNGSTDYMRVNSSGSSGNAFVITNAGNVGINSTTPGQVLDVQGTIRASAALIVSGSGITNFAGGNVGIGSATPGQILDAVGTVRSTQLIVSGIASDAGKTDATVCEDTTVHQFYDGSGTLGVCLGTSTKEAKEHISPVSEGIWEIMALKPISFTYRSGWGYDSNKPYYGFLAEDVEPVLPRLVGRNDKGQIRNADYIGMIPIIVKAIQQLYTWFIVVLAIIGLLLAGLFWKINKKKRDRE